MSPFTFPIPGPDPLVADADVILDSMRQDVSAVLADIGQYVLDELGGLHAATSKPINSVRSYVGRQMAKVQSAVDAAVTDVMTAAAATAGSISNDINTVQTASMMPASSSLRAVPPPGQWWFFLSADPDSTLAPNKYSGNPAVLNPGLTNGQWYGPFATLADATAQFKAASSTGATGAVTPPPPPPPPQAQWWFSCGAVGVANVPITPFLTAPTWQALPAGGKWYGPYASEADATSAHATIAACQVIDTSGGGSSGTGGSGGGSGGNGGPPPPPPPPPTKTWRCVCPQLADGTEGEPRVVDDDGLADLFNTFKSITERGGPFTSEADAHAFCDALEECTTVAPPSNTCVLPAMFKDGLPSPGSPAWCDLQDQIIKWMADVGNSVVSWLLKGSIDLVQSVYDWTDPADSSNPVALYIFRSIHPIVGSVKNVLETAWDCWQKLAAASRDCDATTVIGVMALRTILKMFSKWSAGWDYGVKTVVSFELDLLWFARAADYIAEAICPSLIPSASDAMNAFSQGQIDFDTYTCWANAHGVSTETWKPVLLARSPHIGAQETIQWTRRHKATDEQTDIALRARGWLRKDDRAAVQELYTHLPQLRQAIAWVDAGAGNDDWATNWGLDTSFDDGVWGVYGADLWAQGITEQFARAEWRAHWRLPGHGEMRSYLHRLRPDAEGVTDPVTPALFKAVLDRQGMAPRAVEWAEKTAYNLLSEGHLRLLLDWRTISIDRYREGLLDLGYSQSSADLLIRQVTIDHARKRAAAVDGWTLPKVVLAVRQGVMTTDEGKTALFGQGYTDAEIDAAVDVERKRYKGRLADRAGQTSRRSVVRAVTVAYGEGIISQERATTLLSRAGWPEATATAELSALDAVQNASNARETVTALKRAFMRGEITLQQGATSLQQAGFEANAVNRIIAQWSLEFESRRPSLTVSQILKMVEEGLLDPGIATQRLANLGWQQADQALLGAEIQLKLQQQLQKQVQAALKQQPISKLKTWFVERIITEEYARGRLQLYGIDPLTLNLTMDEWLLARAKADAALARKQPGATLPPEKQESISDIGKLYIAGHHDWPTTEARLVARGFSQPAITEHKQLWDDARDKQQAAAGKKASTVPTGQAGP